MRQPDTSPGTVSKILWHFTGGPKWNPRRRQQSKTPKPAPTAYRNLRSILEMQELSLGDYREIVKVVLPEYRDYDPKTFKPRRRKNVPVNIESSRVCCLADIPAPHLRYHAHRYGKFAIGFHRKAAVQWGFNPVLYSLVDTPVVRSMYQGFSALELADPSRIGGIADRISADLSVLEDYELDVDVDVSSELGDIEYEAETLYDSIKEARKSVEDFAAFVKTFSPSEFTTIYCEREWRSTVPWAFEKDDVAMVVLPRKVGKREYFRPFVERFVASIGLPRRIPVVPWDDLVEH